MFVGIPWEGMGVSDVVSEPCHQRALKIKKLTHDAGNTLITRNSIPMITFSTFKGLCQIHGVLLRGPKLVQFNNRTLRYHWAGRREIYAS